MGEKYIARYKKTFERNDEGNDIDDEVMTLASRCRP